MAPSVSVLGLIFQGPVDGLEQPGDIDGFGDMAVHSGGHVIVDLVRQGFDPSFISDPLYVLDSASGRYEPLTPERYGEILSGHIRL